MHIACRLMALFAFLLAFPGLPSVAGNVHVAAFFGATITGRLAAGIFHAKVCG